MSLLFASKKALEDLPPPPPPRRGHGGPARERVRRLVSVARIEASSGIFSQTVMRRLRRAYTLSSPTKSNTRAGGSKRLLRTMVPNKPNHEVTLVRASSSERRGIACLKNRSVAAWVVRQGSPLSFHFSSSIFAFVNPSQEDSGVHFADAVCYVSGDAGNSSVVQAHHVTQFTSGKYDNIDYLVAPVNRKANQLVTGLVYVDDDDSGYSLDRRGNLLAEMCDLMDAYRRGRIEPPAWVEAKGRAGNTALFDSFLPGGVNDDLLEPVSDALREEAGLDDDVDAYMFTAEFSQSMQFVSSSSVLVHTVVEPTVENGLSQSYSMMHLVYGVCAITGVTFTKTGGDRMKLVLHHITHGKRHILVGFTYNSVNTGLGALGNYKSK